MPSVPNPWRMARPVLCRGASKRSQSWASPKRQRMASEGCGKNCDLLNRRNPAGSAISSGVGGVPFAVDFLGLRRSPAPFVDAPDDG